ncbi:MAG: T9SS type A sorting domain-containing protein [Ekhidna sp.]|nr:T9SS type A sorting domain-containing protein [Ekhidna sp.]
MKRKLSVNVLAVLSLLLSGAIFGQTPQKLSYQAVLRGADNTPLVNQEVGMRISLLTGSATGATVYSETISPSTDASGLVSVEIGAANSADFSAIDWSAGSFFIKTETDLDGGSDYTITATSQLLSVPFALYTEVADYAKVADSASNVFSGKYDDLDNTPDLGVYLTEEVDADSTNEIQSLSLEGNVLSLSRGGSVTLPAGGGSSEGELDIEVLEVEIDRDDPNDFSFDGNGLVRLRVSGGVPPYFYQALRDGSFSFDPINGSSLDGEIEIPNLDEALYAITVEDSQRKSAVRSVYIGDDEVKISIDSVRAQSCPGTADAAIYVTPFGDNGPYTFEWRIDGESIFEEDLVGFDPGQLSSLSVTDVSGNSEFFSSFDFLDNLRNSLTSDLDYSIETAQGVCSGDDGSLTVVLNDADPNETYTFTWYKNRFLDEVLSTTETVTGIGPDVATPFLQITSSSGCVFGPDRVFTRPNLRFNPIVDVDITSDCLQDGSGALDITLIDVDGTVTFEWATDFEFTNVIATTEDLDNLTEGSYYLRLTSEEGCVSRTFDWYVDSGGDYYYYEIEVVEQLNPCPGESNGSVEVRVRGDIDITTLTADWYDFNELQNWYWDDGDPSTRPSPVATTLNLENVPAGYYVLYVQDTDGCSRGSDDIDNYSAEVSLEEEKC